MYVDHSVLTVLKSCEDTAPPSLARGWALGAAPESSSVNWDLGSLFKYCRDSGGQKWPTALWGEVLCPPLPNPHAAGQFLQVFLVQELSSVKTWEFLQAWTESRILKELS